jgi:serine/threonine protein kinase
MDWEARMRTALCAARGVAHLHTAHSLAHGNVKSSNLLLRPDPDAAALSDYCLHRIFPPAPARPGGSGGGYRLPRAGARGRAPPDVQVRRVLARGAVPGAPDVQVPRAPRVPGGRRRRRGPPTVGAVGGAGGVDGRGVRLRPSGGPASRLPRAAPPPTSASSASEFNLQDV